MKGQPYRVRQGGLMRCCLASLDDAMLAGTQPPQEGDTVPCKYCESAMRFRDGAFEWDRPPLFPPGPAGVVRSTLGAANRGSQVRGKALTFS